jgi:hypothetical protein
MRILKKTLSRNHISIDGSLRKPLVEIHAFFKKSALEIIFILIFWVFQTISDDKTTEIKVVDLKKLWNFVVDNVLFEIIWTLKNCIRICQIQKLYQNKSCRA